MIMTKKEDGTYKQVGFIYRNDEINVSGEVPVNFKTMNGVIGDYTIKGNTYQSDGVSPDMPQEVVGCGDRTGNLFDSAWEQGNINIVTGQNEATGTTMRTKDYIPIKPNTVYSFSRNISNGFMNVRLYRADKSYIGSGTASTIRLISGSSVENPMDNNISFCCFEVIDGEASYIRFNDSLNNTATKWLMVEGEYTQQTMPEYEPYGYKIPVETRGKNLFDGWGVSRTFLGLTCETSENMTIVLNGTRIAGLNAQPITRPNITLKAGTYTVSCKMIGGSMEGVTDGVFFGINQNKYAQRTSPAVLKVGDIGKRTFTLTEDTIISSFDITPSYGSPGGIFTNATFECQFEYGSEATEYEPYHEPITTPIYLDKPLYKIGDYADSINYAEQKAERVVKELVLDGTEPWELQSINGNGIANFFIKRSDTHKSALKLICTHYTEQITQIANTATEGVYNSNGNALYIRVKQERASTATAFKSYLAAQYAAGTPVTVYYILVTPETESIDLPKIPTFDGTNIIDINTEIKPSNISLSRPMTEIKKILNKEGKILFEKGFTREVESVLPLTLNGIGKPLKDYDIEGNTEQQTYSGKNLIYIIPFTSTFGTGSAVIRDFLNSLDVGAYVISCNIKLLTRNDSTDNSCYGIRVLNESENFETTPDWGSASIDTVKKLSLKITITADNKGKFTNVYFYGCGIFSVGVTGSAQIYDFQLEAGTEATSYEPYVGKISSPNPDYPQEVKAVGDRTGNLFDITKNVIGNIREDGSVQETSSELYNSSDFIMIKANADYTVSFFAEYNLGGRVSNIAYYDSEKNFLTYTQNVFNGISEKSHTTTSPNNAKYLRFSYIGRGSAIDKNIMLNEGSTPLPYEPYGYKILITTESEDDNESITTPIYLDKPLYKIGDYADCLAYAEQKVERDIKELILTGEENMYIYTGTGSNGVAIPIADMQIGFYQGGFCSHAIVARNHADGTIGLGVENNNCYWFGILDILGLSASVTPFREWLKEQYNNGTPVKVYYILATPETESVTLPKIPTLDGTTVIDVDTEIEPSNMYVKYKSSK